MGWKTFKSERLKCSHCGYDGTAPPENHHTYDSTPFFWVEDTTIAWPVLAVSKSGRIQMGFDFEYAMESGNPRLECGRCHEVFPVPKSAESDWVEEGEIDWEGGG